MRAAITVELDGATFVLDEGAYEALRSYLDRAAARLRKHPDRADVIAGLERRIAAQLAGGPAAQGAPLDRGEMVEALQGVGRVDGPELRDDGPSGATGQSADAGPSASRPNGPAGSSGSARSHGSSRGAAGEEGDARPRARRLYRLTEGSHVAGVCAGLAAFSEVDVGLIRFLFLISTMFSGGVLILGYAVLAFVMPMARTDAEVAAAHGGLPGRLTRG
jgi:phage shock protein PspC (stress-responsive transcriptional regulator)